MTILNNQRLRNEINFNFAGAWRRSDKDISERIFFSDFDHTKISLYMISIKKRLLKAIKKY